MSNIPKTAYTPDQAQSYDETRFVKPSGVQAHQTEFSNLMFALRKLPKSAHILEVGCGTGRLLVDARKAGYRVDGTDGSPSMLDVLREKNHDQYPDLDLKVAEAAKLPYPDGAYDATYSIRLLNQTESPEYALDVVQEMMRITKPGGLVLVEFVNARRPRWGMNRRSTTRLAPSQVVARARACGGKPLAYRGAFFLSMQAYSKSPALLVGLVAALDRAFSWLFPRLCSRCYVLLTKGIAA